MKRLLLSGMILSGALGLSFADFDKNDRTPSEPSAASPSAPSAASSPRSSNSSSSMDGSRSETYRDDGLNLSRFSASIGPNIFLISEGKTDVSAAAAVRCRIYGAETWNISGEVGGLFPPSGTLRNASMTGAYFNDPQTTTNVKTSLNYEVHAALTADLPHGSQTVVVPELALGLSLASITSDYTIIPSQAVASTNGSQSDTDVAPLIRLGLRFFPGRPFSLRMDAGYLRFPVTVHAAGQSFNQNLSGWYAQPSLQYSFGE